MADSITIRAYADGSTLIGSQVVSAGAGFSISVDSSTLSVGSHAISVTAQDTTQGYAESAQVSAGSIAVSAAAASLALDGTPQTATAGYATTAACTLSTSGANRLIIVKVSIAGNSTETDSSASVSGSTLGAFTRIGSITGINAASEHAYLAVYAKMATAQLASEVITLTLGANEGIVMEAKAYSGAADYAGKVANTYYGLSSATNTGTTASTSITTKGSASFVESIGWIYWTSSVTPDGATTKVVFDNPYEYRWTGVSTATMAAGAHTVSATSPDNRDWAILALEVRA